MRTLQLLTYASALVLFSSPAMADIVNVMSEVDQGGVAVPGCGGATAGTSFAATSFSCNLDGFSYSGYASGQTGLGPYGIGVSMEAGSSGVKFTTPFYTSESSVSLSWSQDFVIEGAQGNGFVEFDLARGGDGFNLEEGAGLSVDLFGFSLPDGAESSGPVPVTFGTQYTISMSGFLKCSAFDAFGCGSLFVDISDIEFMDASGNVLSGVSLEPVPEICSWLLLATCAAPVIFWRRSGSKRV